MYRDAFSGERKQALRFDWGVLAAVVCCLVIWAGFIYVLASWAS